MLTGKKKKFATLIAKVKAEGAKPNLSDCAIRAGFAEKTARATASRLMKDKDVLKYIDKFNATYNTEVTGVFVDEADKVLSIRMPDIAKAPTPPTAADLPAKPDLDNETYAVTILRAQLHSDDENVAQRAAKALLDYETKKMAAKGVKQNKEEKAQQAAKESPFQPRVINNPGK